MRRQITVGLNDDSRGTRKYAGRSGTPGRILRDLFPLEYIKDMNGAAAAIRCGCYPKNAKVTASRWMKRPEVRAAIERAIDERRIRTKIDADTILRELISVAMSDVASFYDNAGRLKPLADIEPEARRAIAGIETSEVRTADGTDRTFIQVRKIRLWDKLVALDKLARHLGLLREKAEVSGPDGARIELNEIQRAVRIADLLARAEKRMRNT